jgi:hypothetical protein
MNFIVNTRAEGRGRIPPDATDILSEENTYGSF